MKQVLSPTNFDPNPVEDAYDKIKKFLADCDDPSLSSAVTESLQTMEECFSKYSPGSVSVCFNGGKDCVVMLHIVHAVHQKLFPGHKLKSFYISEKKTFAEVDNFMVATIERYGLENKVYQEPMKSALAEMLSADPEVTATTLGVRMGDPGSAKMAPFSPTDGDWPTVMRVNPILAWDYHQVWRFIRALCLPYPSLYDQGYTSLGNPDNTRPNPALVRTNSAGEEIFLPAYTLQDPGLERQGRT